MILRRIFRENAASPAIRLDNAMSCPKRVSSLPTSRSAINDISDREKLVVAQQLGSVHRLDARLQGPEMVVAKLGRRRLAFHTWHFAPASCFARGERPARLRVGLSVAAAGDARAPRRLPKPGSSDGAPGCKLPNRAPDLLTARPGQFIHMSAMNTVPGSTIPSTIMV